MKKARKTKAKTRAKKSGARKGRHLRAVPPADARGGIDLPLEASVEPQARQPLEDPGIAGPEGVDTALGNQRPRDAS